jgi:capsular polysaccharide biosynthesis protein
LQPHEYVAAVCRRWVWIVAAGLLGGLGSAVVSAHAPVSYGSTTSLYFGVESVTSSADLAASSLIRRDVLPSVAELTRSSLVLQPVIDGLGLDVTAQQLADSLDVVVLEDTAVVEISASAPTAREAALIAREVGEEVRQVVPSLHDDGDGPDLLEVTTIIPAREPRFQASPNTRVDTAMGLAAGGAMGVLLSGVGALLRPRIRRADDVAAMTDVPVLGSLYTAGPRAESISRFLWALQASAPVSSSGRMAVSGPSRGAAALAGELRAAIGARRAGHGVLTTRTTGAPPAAERGNGPTVVHVADPGDLRGAVAEGIDGLVVTVDASATTVVQLRRALASARSSSVAVLGVVVDGVLPPGAGWRARARAALRGNASLGADRLALLSSGAGRGTATFTRSTAVTALFALGLDLSLPMATNTGLLAAVALLPVWATVVSRFRGAGTIAALAALGLVSGGLLAAWSAADHDFSSRQAAETSFHVLTAVGAIGLLLWARTVLPLWTVAVAYGVGQLVTGLLEAPASDNAFKFELALPLTIIVLAVADARRRPLPALAALAVIGVLDILNDARSAFGFCLVAAALVVWQARPSRGPSGRAPWAGVLLLAGIAAGAYLAMSELLVAGALGAEVQARTTTQIEQTGSLLLGGRPEWTATWALMREQPLGFGLGTVPNAADVHLGESGFAVTNIPTAEGYIKNYMFGGRFELHSIVADLWSNLGPVGLVLGLVMAGLLVRSFADLLGRRRAGALTSFLVIGGLWYLAFGPVPANLLDVALALGLVLLPRQPREGRSAEKAAAGEPAGHPVGAGTGSATTTAD